MPRECPRCLEKDEYDLLRSQGALWMVFDHYRDLGSYYCVRCEYTIEREIDIELYFDQVLKEEEE